MRQGSSRGCDKARVGAAGWHACRTKPASAKRLEQSAIPGRVTTTPAAAGYHARSSVDQRDRIDASRQPHGAGEMVDDLPFCPDDARSPKIRIICRTGQLLFGVGDEHLRLPNSQDGWFAAAVRRAQKIDPEFPRISPHDLRHTAASLAISAGANVKAVQRMLGHASAAMTLDTYADLFDDDLDYVAEALSRARHTQRTIMIPESPDSAPMDDGQSHTGRNELTRREQPTWTRVFRQD